VGILFLWIVRVKAIALPKTGIHFTARFHRLAAESLRREPEEWVKLTHLTFFDAADCYHV
jgi:hypothetical protein